MTQFRITKKFALEYKICNFANPKDSVSVLDDWVIDAMRVAGKKLVLVTHLRTMLTFLIPYPHFQNIKEIPEKFAVILQAFLHQHGFDHHVEEVKSLFLAPHLFCNLQNREMMEYMKRIKAYIQSMACKLLFKYNDWNQLVDILTDLLHQRKINSDITPMDAMICLLREAIVQPEKNIQE